MTNREETKQIIQLLPADGWWGAYWIMAPGDPLEYVRLAAWALERVTEWNGETAEYIVGVIPGTEAELEEDESLLGYFHTDDYTPKMGVHFALQARTCQENHEKRQQARKAGA